MPSNRTYKWVDYSFNRRFTIYFQLQGPPPLHPTFAAFVTVEPTEASTEQLDPENSLLGTDVMFLTSFFGEYFIYFFQHRYIILLELLSGF